MNLKSTVRPSVDTADPRVTGKTIQGEHGAVLLLIRSISSYLSTSGTLLVSPRTERPDTPIAQAGVWGDKEHYVPMLDLWNAALQRIRRTEALAVLLAQGLCGGSQPSSRASNSLGLLFKPLSVIVELGSSPF